ncbi:MAG: hypothetical protein CMI79_02360 [Candidatus Pelagibacter sp.]|nr:hypothetical protein [Candidatus Pelagibacter sp.]|tara:strand:+ start:3968 stop:5425 length:1458 start_codon:yes stop_codon:yes gene_type:complete
MEKEIKNFISDKRLLNPFKVTKIILRKINILSNSTISNKLICGFSNIFDVSDSILKIKLKKLIYNNFDYKKAKFKKINLLWIFNDLLQSFYIFGLIFFAKKPGKVSKYDFILHGIIDTRSFERYKKLMLKFNRSLVISYNAPRNEIKNIKTIKISNFTSISSNVVRGKKIEITKLFIYVFVQSLFCRFNYIGYFNLILHSILKNFTLFEVNRAKYFMEDRFYNTCPIRNHYFKKFGGLKTSAPQKNILETTISFFIDTDIFFSLGDEKYSKQRILDFQGRVEKIVPVGSFFMEHGWYRKTRDQNSIPFSDILIMGMNPNVWSIVNKKIYNNYEFKFKDWIKKISEVYPDLKVNIKHHDNFPGNKYEENFFKNSKVDILHKKSKNYSYGFMNKSKIIFSFGSTTILEALSMGKQSYFIDPDGSAKNFYYGLDNLDKLRIKSFNEFKNIIRKVVISKKCKKFNTNVFCLKSDKVSEKVYKYLKKANK